MSPKNKHPKSSIIEVPDLLRRELTEVIAQKYRQKDGKLNIASIQNVWESKLKGTKNRHPPTDETIRKFCSNPDEKQFKQWVVDGFCVILLGCSFEEWRTQSTLQASSQTRLTVLTQRRRSSFSSGFVRIHKNSRIFTLVKEVIKNASHDIWFFGTNFHISLSNQPNLLLSSLQKGVTFRCLIFNPKSEHLDKLAQDFGKTAQRDLKENCEAGLRGLIALMRQWKKEADSEEYSKQIQVKITQSFPRMRAYITDPDDQSGTSVLIPYINQVPPTQLPAFECKNVPGGIWETYIKGIKREWNRASSLYEFIENHPEFIDDYPELNEDYPQP